MAVKGARLLRVHRSEAQTLDGHRSGGYFFFSLDRPEQSAISLSHMDGYSTREAAKRLGLSMATINRYIAAKKIPVPRLTRVGGVRVRLWSNQDIAKVRAVLPTLRNGRKLRYKKQAKKA
jgi:excisionase family DNA binding protein